MQFLKFSGLIILLIMALQVPAHANEDVKCVQDALSQTAYSAGASDGAWGRKTAASVAAAYDQLGFQDYPKEKQNAKSICSVLQALNDDQRSLLAYRLYPIEIDEDEFSQLTGRLAYDFSKVQVDKNRNEKCNFIVKRRAFHDDRREQLASGSLEIIGGRIYFGGHYWSTGGMADETYLKEQANVVVAENGKFFGTMPFFHMFVRAGEEAPPPYIVELGLRKKDDEVGDQSYFWFNVNTWGDGFLQVYGCKGLD